MVQYLKEALVDDGKVIAADWERYSPAFDAADDYEIIPHMEEEGYLEAVLEVCKKHAVKGLLPLMDEEAEILSAAREQFSEIGVSLVLSSAEIVEYCCDKLKTYEYLERAGLPGVPTFDKVREVEQLLEQGDLEFPLIVKPEDGKASQGVQMVKNNADMEKLVAQDGEFIMQPYYKDREFGVDVYVDQISGEMVDMFIKEKYEMNGGATDTSISVHDARIETLMKDLVASMDFSGPLDIDCFEHNGKYYISEINPRLGAGYLHAHEMGCNFMDYLVRNLVGESNPPYEGYRYEKDVVMMKYMDVMLRKITEEEG